MFSYRHVTDQNVHSGLTVDHREWVYMACITQNGSCNDIVKFGTLFVSVYLCFA
jgi:hypothetical protein